MGLNAGGAKVPLSCNNISWNTGNLLFPGNNYKNKIYNWQLCCAGEGRLFRRTEG